MIVPHSLHRAGSVQRVPLLVAFALLLLTWATFLACQAYCAAAFGFVDNRQARRERYMRIANAEARIAFICARC
jgi:hypothetical protein